MKYVFLIISLFNIPLAFSSCLISVESEGKNYHMILWKHVEDKEDAPPLHKTFTAEEIAPIASLLNEHHKLRVVFNNSTFTSMDYYDKKTKRWAALSNAEKDMIFFLQDNFTIQEKLM